MLRRAHLCLAEYLGQSLVRPGTRHPIGFKSPPQQIAVEK